MYGDASHFNTLVHLACAVTEPDERTCGPA
jgi:hypothetical protein